MDITNEIVLYQPDELTQIEVRVAEESVWLNQAQMAELFGTQRQAITKHINNIYSTHELDEISTCSILELVQKEGSRLVKRNVSFYNLDMIISVGFRVNTLRGIQFRRWANDTLKQYLLNGYAINQRLIAIEDRIDRRLNQHEQILTDHQEKIEFFVRTALPPAEKVFFGGEFFDARVALEKIIRTAKLRIIIIDAYVDATTFEMLDVRDKGVQASIYSGKDLTNLRDMHNAQPDVEPIDTFVWTNPSHDRWLIVDDTVYHCGHSLKDMGRKMSAISQMGISAEKILNELR